MSELSRRFFLGSALALAATGALANAPSQAVRPPSRPLRVHPGLRLSLEEILAEARLGEHTGFAVVDLATGQLLEAQNSAQLFPPASVAKAITTLYALEHLPQGFRFETLLLGTGPVEGGVLRGDLVLAGSGDPLLQTDDLARMLQSAGLVQVTGRLLTYAAALPAIAHIDPAQLPQMGYNPSISGLNVNFNRFHLEWKRVAGQWQLAVDARSDTRRPPVHVARVQLAERHAPVFTYARDGGVDQWSVAKSALGEGGSRWLPVRDAAAYAGDVLRSLAREDGLNLPQAEAVQTLPHGNILARHQSPPLAQMLAEMLRWSTNLTAETIGLKATISAGALPLTLSESATRMNRILQERYGASVALVDHSGLGDTSRVSAEAMVQLLVAAKDGPLRGLLRAHKLTDDEGKDFAAPWAQVQAKTGTLDYVSALAGFVHTQGGADLAFAIFSYAPEARAVAKASGDEIPSGVRAWNSRARRMQQRLLQRWGALYPAPLPPL